MLYKYLSCYASSYYLQVIDLQKSAAGEVKLSGFDSECYLDTRSLFCTPPIQGNNPVPLTALLQTMCFQCKDLAILFMKRT